MLDLLQSLRTYYLALPLWVRRLIGRSIISTIILTTWLHLCTHAYAFKNGVRLPLEGVPFMLAFAAIVSVLLSALSAASLSLIPHARIRQRRQQQNENSPNSHDQRDSVAQTLLVIMIASFTLSIYFAVLILILASVVSVQLGGGNYFEILLTGSNPQGAKMPLWLTLSLAFLNLVIALLVERSMLKMSSAMIERTSFSLYVTSVAFTLYILWGSGFEQLLRATKYGGGLVVDIQSVNQSSNLLGSLLLISNNTTAVWDFQNNRFVHLNNSHIISIKYCPTQEFVLPRSRHGGIETSIMSATGPGCDQTLTAN